MVEDILLWNEVRKRITTVMSRQDYKIVCQLHSKYYNHKYKEPCTCNKKRVRQWISDIDSKLYNP